MSTDYLDNNPLLVGLSEDDRILLRKVHEYTEIYFQNAKFDSSHDFKHVMRVLRSALTILREESKGQPQSFDASSKFDARLVVLGALMHDIGDRKYVDSSDVGVPLAKEKLVELGLPDDAASTVQSLVDGVSYSSEIKAPEKVQALILQIPELAIVQDADRLDAIGAVGIGRCFTFGGARRARTLDDSIQHFKDKLLKLEGMMKTATGRSLAQRRSARILEFMSWWEDESALENAP